MERRTRRKLLVASLGVAAVAYVGCARSKKQIDPVDSTVEEVPVPIAVPSVTAAASAPRVAVDARYDPVVANLMVPPEFDQQQMALLAMLSDAAVVGVDAGKKK